MFLWSMAGAFFTSLFFKGLLNLVGIVEDPWGEVQYWGTVLGYGTGVWCWGTVLGYSTGV